MNWNPIATAPKDGTEIILKVGKRSFRAKWDVIHDGCEDGDAYGWHAMEDSNYPKSWCDGICWASNSNEEQSRLPTHWKPLYASWFLC